MIRDTRNVSKVFATYEQSPSRDLKSATTAGNLQEILDFLKRRVQQKT